MVQVNTEERLKILLRKVVRRELKPEENIFNSGLVSSLIFKQIVFSIEKEFAIKFKNTDIRLENLRNIATIAKLIQANQPVQNSDHSEASEALRSQNN